MKWRGREGSRNIEDRRGMGGAGGFGGGGFGGGMGRGGMRGGLPLGGGIGGIVLLLVISFVTGQNPLQLLDGIGDPGGGSRAPFEDAGPSAPVPTDGASELVRVVLKDTEDTWHQIFNERGGTYQEPTLVLFAGATQSACGLGESAMGPFYCPGDRKVYLDTSFFQELDQRFGAPGDFAQAYVIAHEIGHHIQTLTGVSERVTAARRQSSEAQSNALSVRQELQADCYAGVWGNYAAKRQLLEPGDVEEGLTAAAAIGDDTLQRQAQGRVVPESFTHGSSEQRVQWFRRGLESGRIETCDTFGGR